MTDSGDTIPAVFARQAACQAARPLFLVKRAGRYEPITWAAAAQDVAALAAYLLREGVAPGARVLILSENRPEWGLADLAIQSIGAWSVPIYPSLGPADIRIIAADCRPVLAVASTTQQAEKLVAVAREVPSLARVLQVEPVAGSAGALVMGWGDALAQGRAEAPRQEAEWGQRQRRLRPEDPATIIYTSGTTGEPKGVLLSHRNFLSNVEACLAVTPISGSDTHLSFLPLSHVFERMAGWYLMLCVGATVAYAESMDTIPQDMAQVRPTVMLGVPRFFEKLYARVQEGLQQMPPGKRRLVTWAMAVGRRHGACLQAGRRPPPGLQLQRWAADRLVCRKLRGRFGGRLRFFVSGSAALARELGEFFFGVGVTILEGYGLTETSPVIAVNRLPVPRFGSVGPVIPGVEVRIADDGEILTRGPHVMQGYYGRPEETARVIVDGWFHTGDIGRVDPDGYVYITDRKRDLIKTAGGKFVAPQKLENLFVSDPLVSQAFVYGERRPYCVALIVPNAEGLRREAAAHGWAGTCLADWARDPRVQTFYWQRIQERQRELASFEQVKKIALLDQEFSQGSGELTPTMKVRRGVIADRYGGLLQGLYEGAGQIA
jgi:long-chain acyl-CoA synthetase